MRSPARLQDKPDAEIIVGCRQRPWEGAARMAGCLGVLAAGVAGIAALHVVWPTESWGPVQTILQLVIFFATLILGATAGSFNFVSSMHRDEFWRRSTPEVGAFKARLGDGARLVALVVHHGSRSRGAVVECRAVVDLGHGGLVVGSCVQDAARDCSVFREELARHFDRPLGAGEVQELGQALTRFLDDVKARNAADYARMMKEGNRLRLTSNVHAAWGRCEEVQRLILGRDQEEELERLLRAGADESPGMIDWRTWSPGGG